MTNYYHAQVFRDGQKSVWYHDITQVSKFLFYIKWFSGISTSKIYFYKKPNRKAQRGDYCGKWTPETDLTFTP